MARGTLVILSGPSGVGKDTVINAWHARDPRVQRVVAYTTRPARSGETHGFDYQFVSLQEFLRLAEAGAFLEFKEVHGNHYATPLHDMEQMLEEGKVAVLKVDVQGALTVMEMRPDAASVFLMPPSSDELERRIRARNLDAPDVIVRRLINAREEMALAHHYQHQIVNDAVDDVVTELTKIFPRTMNIVLGVSGSVAAYRAADLARELMRHDCTVRVCLTDSAQKFVTPALFEALTGQPCLLDTFEEPDRGRMAHIDWARQADAIVVAPATASTIAKVAFGIGEDMLTTLILASAAPLVIAPAMNPQMYAGDATREAMTKLRERAAMVVEPVEGDVACGEHGQGKLASIAAIVEAVMAVARRSRRLAGKKVLITSGPTQEPIDDVRFVSNRSSGKMGAALARAALLMGAEVTVVSGPVRIPLPLQANVVRVRTAEEMLKACLKHGEGANLIIGAAAVADYRPASKHRGKLRRSAEPTTLELLPNPDVIAELAKAFPDATVVGFAAEPSRSLEVAREKLARKGLAAIAANDVSRAGIGFDAEQNNLRLVTVDGPVVFESGVMSKLGCALWLLDRVSL